MPDFLLDENMPLSVVSTLEEQGYRARHVAGMGLGGAPDETIFDRAQAEGWIIVSRDLGFGSLLDYPLGTHAGIVVVRVPYTFTAAQVCSVVSTFLSTVAPETLREALAIVEPGRYRIRR
jgi:predicted nuclease of predicted toxin-antitoxin system